MITIEDIKDIVKEKAEILKLRHNNKRKRDEYPFTPVYDRTVEMYERIKVHSQSDVYPEKLFREKAPNQSDAEWIYQRRVFEAIGSITHPYWDKALGAINRIWNEKNYTIKYPEIDSSIYDNYPVIDYFNSVYPEHGSIEAYFRSIVTRKKIEDPNAWLCTDVRPIENDNEPPKPYLCIFGSKYIMDYKEDHHLLVKTDEKVNVLYYGRRERKGVVLRFYDATGVYRIEQVGNYIDFKFGEPILEYAWNFDRMPCWRLKGKPVYDDGYTLYESYFYAAIPSLNTVIIDFATNQLAKIINTFPERWEYVDDCDAPNCDGGYVWDDHHENRSMCTSCNGTGRRNFSSVTSVMQVQVPKSDIPGMANTKDITIPPAGYIDKTNANDQIRLLIEEQATNIVRAFAMLNIEISNTSAKGSETALGKQIDREELFSFLMQISSELFDLLFDSINAIGMIRYGNAWKPVQIGYPQNFAIRNDEDLTKEISEGKKAGIPDVAIQALLKQYADTRFNSQEGVQDVFTLVFAADRLITSTPTEISQKLLNQTAAKWEAILHDSITNFIEQAEDSHEPTEEYPSFWDLPMQERVKILQDLAISKEANISQPRFTPEQLIEQANANKVDAAKNLRGTVGGLTGILDIITKVGEGVYEPQAAIQLLMNAYLYTEEEAKQIIGNPKPVPTV